MRWVVVAGWPDYEISDEGEIRRSEPEFRYHHITGRAFTRLKAGSPVKVKRHKKTGYCSVRLCGERGQKFFLVHRLVCEAFHGPAPSKRHHAAHSNGDRSDNRVDNIAWKLPVQNAADKIAHGTHGRGERNPAAKLSAKDVLIIAEMLRANELSQSAIARRYGVTPGAIWLIARGKKWGHLTGAADQTRVDAGLIYT